MATRPKGGEKDLCPMENDIRLRRLQFRAWHRGTREADMMIGGFFDRYGKQWLGSELNWFERLLEEDDVDIMAWAIGKQPVPDDFAGAQMEAMQKRSEEHTSELQSLMRISN